MLEDRFGLPLSTQSQRAVEAYVAGLDLLLSVNVGAEDLLFRALEHDPEFALAHIALARAHQTAARAEAARSSAARARKLAAGLPVRERGHIDIVALVIDGKGSDAFALLISHLEDYPRDALPLSLAVGVYGLFGFSGRADHHAAQRDLLESLKGHWGEDWWFLTNLGWTHIETGNHGHGIALVDRALEGNPRNGHGAHARAHGYYETGEAAAGCDFIADWIATYDKASPLHCHISWHRALFAFHLGDVDQAMAIYRDDIRPGAALSIPMFTLIDSAAFAWRGHIYGHPLAPPDASEIADYALQHFPRAGLPFVNVHAALALGLAREAGELARHLGEVDALLAQNRQAPGPVLATICAGIAAFAEADYGRAGELLAAALEELARIGGSHAQRDVVVDTLITAHLRCDQPEAAAAVVARRAESRAGHLNGQWLDRIADEIML